METGPGTKRAADPSVCMEPLEGRRLLSVTLLEGVALHEFGHSLGLEHTTDPSSIMYPYFNANYDLANFASDSAVATLRAKYSDANVAAGSTAWKDSLDGATDGVISLTYSFVPDGTATDVGGLRNTLFATFNRLFGDPSAWKPYFADALARWAGVSDGNLTFAEHSDAGKKWGYVGSSQGDPYSGDIRIGAHARDGAGGVLAYAYYPRGGNKTFGGDVFFDDAENWAYGLTPATPTGGARSTSSSSAATTAGPASATDHDVATTLEAGHDDVLTGNAAGLRAVFA